MSICAGVLLPVGLHLEDAIEQPNLLREGRIEVAESRRALGRLIWERSVNISILRRAAAAACLGFFTIGMVPASGAAGSLSNLPGRWTGKGMMHLQSGDKERVKCVATYFVRGGEVKQNLRCASASYRIDARTVLNVSGSRITGSWIERSFSSNGSISGRLTDDGFRLRIVGDAFTAGMTVAGSSCRQTLTITPSGTSIKNISIGLAKC